MTGPFGDELKDIQALIDAYTPEDIADGYSDMFWAILESLVVITTLPLAKMIEYAENTNANRLGGAVEGTRQRMILHRLHAIQKDFLKGELSEVPHEH